MAVDQKTTSASWGGGHGPHAPPALDPPLASGCHWSGRADWWVRSDSLSSKLELQLMFRSYFLAGVLDTAVAAKICPPACVRALWTEQPVVCQCDELSLVYDISTPLLLLLRTRLCLPIVRPQGLLTNVENCCRLSGGAVPVHEHLYSVGLGQNEVNNPLKSWPLFWQLVFHNPKIMTPPQCLPLQMTERLLRAQPDSLANHVTARLISTLCLRKKRPKLFSPRCMECRRGLAMKILSVRPSNAWFVTKQKEVVPAFLYYMKDHFVTRIMVLGAIPSTYQWLWYHVNKRYGS